MELFNVFLKVNHIRVSFDLQNNNHFPKNKFQNIIFCSEFIVIAEIGQVVFVTWDYQVESEPQSLYLWLWSF